MNFDKLFNDLVLIDNPELKFEDRIRVSNILLLRFTLANVLQCKLNNGVTNLTELNKRNFYLFYVLYSNNIKDYFTFEEFYTSLIGKVENFNLRNQNYLFIYLFIYWEMLGDEITNNLNISTNPFEPVFKMIKRKGYVTIVHGEYDIGGIGIRFKEGFYLPSLKDEFLDFIDSKCKLLGSGGIPNQERVNELWEEFNKINKNG